MLNKYLPRTKLLTFRVNEYEKELIEKAKGRRSLRKYIIDKIEIETSLIKDYNKKTQ